MRSPRAPKLTPNPIYPPLFYLSTPYQCPLPVINRALRWIEHKYPGAGSAFDWWKHRDVLERKDWPIQYWMECKAAQSVDRFFLLFDHSWTQRGSFRELGSFLGRADPDRIARVTILFLTQSDLDASVDDFELYQFERVLLP